MNVAAQITFTPGTVISRLISAERSASAQIRRSTASISESRKSDLAQGRVDRLALLGGQVERGQPAPPLGPEGLSERGAAHQAAHQRRMDLVLGPRPGADQLGPAPETPAHHLRFAVGHPDPVELAGGQQPGQRADVEPVGLRPRAANPGVGRETTTTSATCASTIRLIAHALPVTSSATRSRGSRLCANNSSSSGLVEIRPAERTSPASAIATSQKST